MYSPRKNGWISSKKQKRYIGPKKVKQNIFATELFAVCITVPVHEVMKMSSISSAVSEACGFVAR